MTRDEHTIAGPNGSIRLTGEALAGLVISAAELVDGARVRRPRRGVDVVVADGHVRVELELAARYGSVLPELAHGVQERVAAALGESASLDVDRVNVAIEELDA